MASVIITPAKSNHNLSSSTSENSTNIDQSLINGKPVTKLKVDELKQELAARGLEKSGLKKELQERLHMALTRETSCNDETNGETKVLVTQTTDCSMLRKRNVCYNCYDRDQELKVVKMQVTALQNQIFSLNRVVNSLNTVVESLYKVLESNNKAIYECENLILRSEHKLADVLKDKDDLRADYCSNVGLQQKSNNKNNCQLRPPNIKKHVQEVEHLINAPTINDNTSSELRQSVGERPLSATRIASENSQDKQQEQIKPQQQLGNPGIKQKNWLNYLPLLEMPTYTQINYRSPENHQMESPSKGKGNTPEQIFLKDASDGDLDCGRYNIPVRITYRPAYGQLSHRPNKKSKYFFRQRSKQCRPPGWSKHLELVKQVTTTV